MTKVKVGPHIWGIAFDQELNTLYLAHTGTADVTALNENTLNVTKISVGAIPCAVAVNPLTQRLYAVNYGDQTLSVIDARTSEVLATLPVGKHPQAVAVDAVHNRVYVANVHGNSVTAIDGAKNAVIGTYNAGNNPYALAIDPEGIHLYAANYGETPVTSVPVSQ
jgi:YVTN family beta-propeller protein